MKGKTKIQNYSIENIKALNSNNSDFDFFSFEYFATDIEHLKIPHRHDFYTIILTLTGSGRHTVDFNQYEIIPHRVFLINYGQLHHWNELKKTKGYVVLFTENFYNLIYTGNEKIKSDEALQGNKEYIDLDDVELKEWISLMELIEHEFSNNAPNSKEIICLLLKALVLKYNCKSEDRITVNKKNMRKLSIVNGYKKLINEYYKEWKLPKLYAQLLNITPNYLNAVCKQILNKSATELIKERVILEAQRLLTHSDDTVTQIAYELGFDDNSNFGKYFKLSTKKSPEQFKIHFLKSKNIEQ